MSARDAAAQEATTAPLDPAVVLVVDDEPSICWGFKQLLQKAGHHVLTAASAEEGLRLAADQRLDLVLLDVRLPGEDGITALPRFQTATEGAPVIVMTAFGDLDTAVQAVRNGAIDYLTKPFRLQDAARACQQAIASHQEASRRNPSSEAAEPQAGSEASPDALVGRSPAMQEVFRKIALVAESQLSVLVTGETGTGKELVAAAIHRHSPRSEQVYLPIAPVALSPSLLESELFGHVKGAFTGAEQDRRGLFELADGGTLLLDEIGDLPLGTQVKLLRVLEQGYFTRVGDLQPRRCNVRIIAATNADLHTAAHRGDFREDLLYRLSAVHVHLPPLRERREDIPLLCEHFLQRLDYPAAHCRITEELATGLMQRRWSGNVRELRNAVEHASVVARGRALTLHDFPAPRPQAATEEPNRPTETLTAIIKAWTTEALEAGEDDGSLQQRFQRTVEPPFLQTVLRHTNGNLAAAAKRLGIDRGTLRDRLRQLDE